MSDQNPTSRRNALRLIASASSLAIAGTASADEEDLDLAVNQDDREDGLIGEASKSGGKTGTLEDVATEQKTSSGIQLLASDDSNNLAQVDDMRHEYDVEGRYTGYTIAETEHLLVLHEAVDDRGNRVTDFDDRYVYVAEHYSRSEGVHRWWHGDPKTTKMENHLDVTHSDIEVRGRDPKTTSTVDGDRVNVGIDAQAGPVGIGMSGSVYVDNGSIGPGAYSAGSAGEYEIQLTGCNERDVVDILGYTLLRSERPIYNLTFGLGSHLSWSTYTRAQTTNGGPC